MLNLVEKFTSEAIEDTNEDGVVAIEYVLMAGVVAVGITTVAFTGVWGDIKTKLDGIV
jgi:Flp pilus assembly pilin Flp